MSTITAPISSKETKEAGDKRNQRKKGKESTMRRRRIFIKNEPTIIIASQTTTKTMIKPKANISDSNVQCRFAFKNIIPVVNAIAPPDSSPPQLTSVKFSDLPLYVPILPLCKTEVTKDHEVKLVHKTVYPYVAAYRKEMLNTISCIIEPICEIMCNVTEDVIAKKNKFKKYMRHPDNLLLRQAVFTSGTAAGLVLGSKTYAIRRIFWGIVGALFTGWLCFPKETDSAIRQISYKTSTILPVLLSKFCNQTYSSGTDQSPCFKDICIPTNEYVGNPKCKNR